MKINVKLITALIFALCVIFAMSSCSVFDFLKKDDVPAADDGNNNSEPTEDVEDTESSEDENEEPEEEEEEDTEDDNVSEPTRPSGLKVVDNEVFSYDEDGYRLNCDHQFVEFEGNTYYAINNIVAVGEHIIESKVYKFDSKGKMVRFLVDEEFYEHNGAKYYVIDNTIVYGLIVIGGRAYNFGDDGKMIVGEKDGYTYDANGRLVADHMFFTVNDSVYYFVNNTTVRGRYILNDSLYDFGSDGKMAIGYKDDYFYGPDGKLVATNVFYVINGSTYYVVDNTIVYNRRVIDGYVYDFGDDGRMIKDRDNDGYSYNEDGHLYTEGRAATKNGFVSANEATYYMVGELVVEEIYLEYLDRYEIVYSNVYKVVYDRMIINDYMYDFGSDGKMTIGVKGEYTYDVDGKLIASNEFVAMNGATYYLINNRIIKGRIALGRDIYDFGTDGKMLAGKSREGFSYGNDGKIVASNKFVKTYDGATYYVVENKTVLGRLLIGDAMYDFGLDGKMLTAFDGDKYVYGDDGKLMANYEFIPYGEGADEALYFLIDNAIVRDMQLVIKGNIYYFGSDGKMYVNKDNYGSDGKLIREDGFIIVNSCIYYLVKNTTVYGEKEIGGTKYTFDKDGKLDLDEAFTTININGATATYYLVEKTISYGRMIISKRGYDFGTDGKMVIGDKDGFHYGEDGALVLSNGFYRTNDATYYFIDNVIVFGRTVIGGYGYSFGTDGKMIVGRSDGYTYGSDGKLISSIYVLFTVEDGATYYFVNNVIAYGQWVINGFVYDFGNDGKMVIGEKGECTYDKDGKLIATETFITVRGATYYLIDNKTVYDRIVISGFVYNFGTDGKMYVNKNGYGSDGKLVATNIFVTINGETYYIVDNETVYGQIVIDGYVYDFGRDGKMFSGVKGIYVYGDNGKMKNSELFITVRGATYYLIDGKTVYNRIVIDGCVYDFGSDGKMVIENTSDGYYYGEDGKLCADNIFIVVKDNVYYVINNRVVCEEMEIGEVTYDFAKDGKLIMNEEFIVIRDATYYVVNNAIVYGQIVIGGYVYDFGEDGKMVIGDRNGYTYDNDGKLVADNIFITVNGATYYIVDNVTVYNRIVIDGYVYDFGEDGKMIKSGNNDGYTYAADGKLTANNFFITVNGATYYLVNSKTVYGHIVIDGYVYDFGDDGKMVIGEKDGYVYGADGKLVANNIFITIDDATYYIVNNKTVYNRIVINGYIYDFGNDGKMVANNTSDGYTYGEDGKICGSEFFIVVLGYVYYIVDNNIVCEQTMIDGVVYNFTVDGKLIMNEKFIVIAGETYYMVNNVTVYGQIVINGYVYGFGEDGKMLSGEYGDYTYGEDGKLVADNIFITINSETYYIVNNVTVYNRIVIDGYVYDFGNDGKMVVGCNDGYTYGEDGKMVANQVFVVVKDYVYYVVKNTIVYNKLTLNGVEYDFGDDGKLVADHMFIAVVNGIYYVVNNTIIHNHFVIDGYVYDFGNDGKMVIGEKGECTYGADGKLITGVLEFELDGKMYFVYNGQIFNELTFSGTVYESDDDEDLSNNVKLSGVTVKLVIGDTEFTVVTDSEGRFVFEHLLASSGQVIIALDGYVTLDDTKCWFPNSEVNVVLEREV